MPKRNNREGLHKHTLNLREGDWDYIESVYLPKGLATAVVIRTIVSNLVDRLRKQEEPTDIPSDYE